ncbi:hypothetical protein SSCG_00651 [Streptomyces clavuligerus]|nr:hypothetical protein SSCG_00651 [Streptomyces clavuligerus]
MLADLKEVDQRGMGPGVKGGGGCRLHLRTSEVHDPEDPDPVVLELGLLVPDLEELDEGRVGPGVEGLRRLPLDAGPGRRVAEDTEDPHPVVLELRLLVADVEEVTAVLGGAVEGLVRLPPHPGAGRRVGQDTQNGDPVLLVDGVRGGADRRGGNGGRRRRGRGRGGERGEGQRRRDDGRGDGGGDTDELQRTTLRQGQLTCKEQQYKEKSCLSRYLPYRMVI